MPQLVKACPRCGNLMWIKEGGVEQVDDDTVKTVCPHCKQTIRFKLTAVGANALGPKMGH